MAWDGMGWQLVQNERLALFYLPQTFLQHGALSRPFVDIVLCNLLVRLPILCDARSPVALTILQLFRFVFSSAQAAPQNELVIKAYLYDLVSSTIKLASTAKNPNHYYVLLRNLFRGVGGGKFEQVYKEFQYLMPELFDWLMMMFQHGPDHLHEATIELCLTIPARLSSLLQYIPILMNAIVLALQAADDNIVKLGLRTLGLCLFCSWLVA